MGIGRHIIIRKVWDTLVLTMTCLPWHYLRMIWKKNWGKITKLPDFKQKQQKKQILRHMPLLRHIMPALNKTQFLGRLAALYIFQYWPSKIWLFSQHIFVEPHEKSHVKNFMSNVGPIWLVSMSCPFIFSLHMGWHCIIPVSETKFRLGGYFLNISTDTGLSIITTTLTTLSLTHTFQPFLMMCCSRQVFA